MAVRSSPGRRVVDLTLPMHPGMPVYPGDPEVVFAASEEAGFTVTRVGFGTHTGTHLDAPRHILPEGPAVDAIPLGACVGPARVADCAGLERIGVAALRARAPNLPAGARLLVRTDWDRRFGTDGYYTRFPGLTLPAARWLVERRIALVGVETPSLCPEADAAAHRLLLEAGIVVVEGLAGLRDIGCETCWFAALPLRLSGLDGSPVRAVAWEWEVGSGE